MKRNKLINLLLLWSLSLPAFALSTDPDQPVNIEADAAEVDDERGITKYTGSVVMTQGSIRIRADKVTIYSGDDGMERAVLNGKPARFRQQPDNSDKIIRASAGKIEFLATKDMLYLIGGAKVTQGADSFQGNRITYDTKRNMVKAKKAKSGKQRVKITINPKKKTAKKSNKKP
ncbi:MAG: lipopolysaccharide transport periplasmic protein LptA [Gammaproteobacteria bacterium]|nr:lipopolysaccharide transport periplasmic protein LptA [Gammaproteobacteria bacterium]